MASRFQTLALAGAASIGLATAASALSLNSLIQNAGFETLTNGYGQLGYNTNAAPWSVVAPPGSYAFVFNAANVLTGVTGQFGPASMWAATASPFGGNFVGLDSAFQVGPLSQTITGLTVGQTYELTFAWAAAQQRGFDGPTYDEITVSLGNESHVTNRIDLGSHEFSGWTTETISFTATSTTEVLSFLATGGPPGLPPFALIDLPVSVPEPGSLALLGAGLLGLGGMVRRRR